MFRVAVVAVLLAAMSVPSVVCAVPVECDGFLLAGDVLGWGVCVAVHLMMDWDVFDNWQYFGNPG